MAPAALKRQEIEVNLSIFDPNRSIVGEPFPRLPALLARFPTYSHSGFQHQ
jgi:hypothetical protein